MYTTVRLSAKWQDIFSKAEWKYEIQCPLLFKLDPARCYLRRHMKASGFEIARQFIDLYYLSSLEK